MICFCQIGETVEAFETLNAFHTSKALYLDFNAVECPLPDIQPYLVSVSNDGVADHASNPLLFVPFDSACYACSTNTTTCHKLVSRQSLFGNIHLPLQSKRSYCNYRETVAGLMVAATRKTSTAKAIRVWSASRLPMNCNGPRFQVDI